MKFVLTVAAAASLFLFSCSNPVATGASDALEKAAVGPAPLSYYVANNGNNNNAGTSSASAFKTITYALSKAAAANPQAGNRVVVHVAPGNYTAQNAELFPLNVPAHVQLVGDVAHSGNGPVPTKISGQGALPNVTNVYAAILAHEDDVIAGLTITTNSASSSGRHFGILMEGGLGINIAYCSIIYNETGIYAAGNTQATLHDNAVEKNNTGVQLNDLTPQDGSITELYRNSIRYNSLRGVYLGLGKTSTPPDLGGQQIGTYDNQFLGPIPIYGKGLNVLAWNTVQDLYIDSYAGVSEPYFVYARNNSWSKTFAGGTSGGVIVSVYPNAAVDSSNASLAPATPSVF